jgi:hypothetical protein
MQELLLAFRQQRYDIAFDMQVIVKINFNLQVIFFLYLCSSLRILKDGY